MLDKKFKLDKSKDKKKIQISNVENISTEPTEQTQEKPKTQRIAKTKQEGKALFTDSTVVMESDKRFIAESDIAVERDDDYEDPYCVSISTGGIRCTAFATNGNYCGKHGVKTAAKSKSYVTALDIPGKFKLFKQVKDVNVKMDEELSLLRALLQTVVYKYEHELASEYDIINIVEQITRVQNHQIKFLPGKRPLDTDAIIGLVSFILESLQKNQISPVIISNITGEIDNMLRIASNDSLSAIKKIEIEEKEYSKFDE